jgi:hypothetical protein
MVFIDLTDYSNSSKISLDSDRIQYCKQDGAHGATTLRLSVPDNGGSTIDVRVKESPSSITSAVHLHEAQIAANTEIMLQQHAGYLKTEEQLQSDRLRQSFQPSS